MAKLATNLRQTCDTRVVLGIDPGTSVTGYGLVRQEGNRYIALDYGAIRPPRNRRLSERRAIIFEEVGHLLEEHKPDALSLETQFVQKNIRSAMKLSVVGGIITLAATLRDIPVYEYAPSKAKIAISGRGLASKDQVREMCARLLSLGEPPPSDAADALALAICHFHAFDPQEV